MSDRYTLIGSWGTVPMTGPLLASGATTMQTPVNETVVCSQKHYDELDLTTDGPVSVDFGGLSHANVINVFSNQPVTVRLTSAAGAQQAATVDGWLMLGSRSAGYTALDLTRLPGQETTVKVFLGQKS